MITLSFTVGREDVLAFYQSFYAQSATVQSMIRRAQIVCLAIFFLGIVYGSFRFDGLIRLVLVVILLGLGLIWHFLLPKYFAWHAIRTSEKMFEETSLSKSLGQYDLRFSEEGIWSSSPAGQSRFRWELVDRVLLTPSHLMIVLAGGQGYPIPRSQIEEPQLDQTTSFIESRILAP